MSESPRETVHVHWRCLASRFAANRRAWHLTGSVRGNGPPRSQERLAGTLQRKLKTDPQFGWNR